MISIFLPSSGEALANDLPKKPTYDVYVAEFRAICTISEEVFKYIDESQQSLSWANVESNGYVVSLWENESAESFTLIKSEPSGDSSCIISMHDGTDVTL